MMKRRQIANTDIHVSPIGLGTVKLGRNQGVKYPSDFKIPDDKAATQLIALARELGINLIDTAPAYGNSEERLGKLLNKQRQDWIICTKVGEEYCDGQSSYHFDESHTKASIERSLQQLNTDYLDIVLVHSDGNDVDIIKRYGILDQLAEYKRAGLIRAFGMSTKTVEGGILAAEKSDLVMVSHNLVYQDEVAVLDYCQAHNKGVFIKKAFASGHLCDQTADPVQASMDFIFSHPGVSSIIVGTINPQHLRHNVSAALQAIS
jgi:aryl-alcohol dehydrogenase-like predicted oxidoreductase